MNLIQNIVNLFKKPTTPPPPIDQWFEIVISVSPDSITGNAHPAPTNSYFNNHEIIITDAQTPYRYTAFTHDLADSPAQAVQKAISRTKEFASTPEGKAMIQRSYEHSIALDTMSDLSQPATKQDIDNLRQGIRSLARSNQ